MKVLGPLLFLAVGLVAGYLFSEFALIDEPAPIARVLHPEGTPDSSTAQPATPPPARDVTDPALDPASPAEGSPTSPAGNRMERLRLAVAEIPARESLRGDGVVRATVLDELGRPVSGVRVTLRPLGLSSSVQPIDRIEIDLEEYIRERIDEQRYRCGSRQVEITDALGQCVFEGLAGEQFRVEAEAPGVTFDRDEPGVVVPGRDIVLRAHAGQRVQVLVRDRDGVPLNRAHITVSGSRGGTSHTWTPTSPAMTLALGRYELEARTESGLASERTVVVVGDNTPDPIALTLLPKPELLVEVEAENTASQLLVHLYWREADATIVDVERLVADGWQRLVPVSGGRGSSTVSGLVPGTYCVAAGYTEDRLLASSVVTLVEGRTVARLMLPPVESVGALRFFVFHADGSLAEDAHVELSAEGGSFGGPTRQFRDADGAVVVVPPRALAALLPPNPSRPLAALVRVPGVRGRRLTVTASETTVHLGAPARLEVEVLGITSKERSQVRLSLIPIGVGATDRAASPLRVDPEAGEGRRDAPTRLVASTEAGDYVLQGSIGMGAIEPRPVRLEPGTQSLVLERPASHRLVLNVSTEADSATLHARNREFVTGVIHDGRVIFESVPSGEYFVEIDGDFMRFQVGRELQVDFQPMTLNALEFVILDPILTDVHGLHDGDLIIAVAGETFSNPEEAEHVFSTLLASQTMTIDLEVLRAGNRVKVDLNEAQLQDFRNGLEKRATVLPAQR
ncbi:MAG: hypothetical protein AB7O52_06355 [Planctomycetota bacterium]